MVSPLSFSPGKSKNGSLYTPSMHQDFVYTRFESNRRSYVAHLLRNRKITSGLVVPAFF